jgi:enamine deaminase RidA (YjgF/YER057c/UK114 family)
MTSIAQRLAELGITLPAPPRSVANFVPCVQMGNLLFVSGQICSENGQLRYVGRVGAEVSVEDAKQAARLCALNILSHVNAFLGGLDRVSRVCQVQGFVNAVPGFGEQPAIINGASEVFVDVFGEQGRHARYAIGAGSLPYNVAVEVAAIFEVRDGGSR